MSAGGRPRWALRVASDPADGAGHAARSGALATTLPGRVRLFVDPGPLPAALAATELETVVEAAPGATDRLAAALSGEVDAVLIDSYRVGEAAIAGIARRRPCAVFRDGVPRGAEQVAIDPSPTAVAEGGRLAGPAYAPLAPAIVRASRAMAHGRRAPQRPDGGQPHLAVAFGARDDVNVTGRVLDRLAPIAGDLQITVLMGLAAPHLAEIRERTGALPDARLLVGHTDVAGFYADVDLAVGAPGVSQLERLCLGVPTVLLPQAEMHGPLVEAWVGTGAALAPTDGDLAGAVCRLAQDRELARTLADRGQALVDGRGSERLAAALVTELRLEAAA